MLLQTRLLFFFLLAVLLYSGCARPPAQTRWLTIEEGVLAVGVEIGYPPMEYYGADGKTLTGFDIELARALAERLGLEARFIDTAWEGILAGLDVRRYDMAVNITILPERQKNYNFTRPYIGSSITIAALKSAALTIEKPEDIAGQNVCFQGNTTAQYFTEKLLRRGIDFTPFAYDNIMYCFDELLWGRVTLVAADNITAHDYAGPEQSPYEVIWEGPADEYIGICLKKGNDALTAALNSALDELFEDGTLLNISHSIFNRDLVSAAR